MKGKEPRYTIFRCKHCKKVTSHILQNKSLQYLKDEKHNLIKVNCKFCNRRNSYHLVEKFPLTASSEKARDMILKYNPKDELAFVTYGIKNEGDKNGSD